MSSELYKKTLARYQKNENDDIFHRAAYAFSSDDDHAQRMEKYFKAKWCIGSTPIMCNGPIRESWNNTFIANFNKSCYKAFDNKHMPIACFGGVPDDTLKGLCQHTNETRMMSIASGGTSGYWGGVRSSYSDKGPGPIPFIKTMDSDCIAYQQSSEGANRRGAYAAYLDITHPDIEEFLDIRKAAGGDSSRKSLNIHHGVCITNDFLERVTSGETLDLIEPNTGEVRKTVKARDLWFKILDNRLLTGEPYLFNVDNANKDLWLDLKKQGKRIVASNLCCVTGDTLILTDKGHEPIGELVGQYVNVWNGTEYSNVEIVKTGEDQEIVEVVLSDGRSIHCTKYHSFYVKNSYYNEAIKTRADQLVEGDKLIKLVTPVIEGDKSLSLDYENGFYSADGCYYKGKSIIMLYGDKINLENKMQLDSPRSESEVRVTFSNVKGLVDKFFVPDSKYKITTRLRWLAGYLDGDGCVLNNAGTISIQAASTEPGFIREVQAMLQTLGVQSKVVHNRDAGIYKLPDQKGGLKEYSCKKVERLLIANAGVNTLVNLGLTCNRLVIPHNEPDRDSTHLAKVVSITPKENEDTYCFNEPKKGLGVFNGILTGQSEVSLPSAPGESFVCCLASLNAEYYEDWKDTDIVGDLVEFLDNVLTFFIQNASKDLRNAIKTAREQRNIGIGLMGFHTLLQELREPFGGLRSKSLANTISKNIFTKATEKSNELSWKRGQAPCFKDTNIVRRNAYLINIAPNVSSSVLLDTSASIEPIKSNAYTSRGLSGAVYVFNKTLRKVLKEYGRDDHEIWKSIDKHDGSIQHLDFLSNRDKSIFRTAKELDQMDIIKLAIIRQSWVDQAQSLNLFFKADHDLQEASDVHMMAMANLKSLYYLRSHSVKSDGLVGSGLERRALESCFVCE